MSGLTGLDRIFFFFSYYFGLNHHVSSPVAHSSCYECIVRSYRWGQLLPQLQSLDTLLSTVTWRERFVAVCFRDRSQQERDKVMHWSADGLAGLRWQVISSFCKEVLGRQYQLLIAVKLYLRTCWPPPNMTSVLEFKPV